MPEPPKIETGRPKLLDQVRAAIRLRHYSRRTEESYVGWIRRYIVFHGKRHPLEMGATEVAGFLTHLAERARVSASTQNQALCALLFLYRRVLERPLEPLAGVAWAKKMSHVPVVLSQEEVARVLDQLRGGMWLIAVLLYGAGLRLTVTSPRMFTWNAMQIVRSSGWTRSDWLGAAVSVPQNYNRLNGSSSCKNNTF